MYYLSFLSMEEQENPLFLECTRMEITGRPSRLGMKYNLKREASVESTIEDLQQKIIV